MRITLSGVKSRFDPSMWLRNSTPSSAIVRSVSSEKTWKPPESVSIGPSHRMNACSPPIARTSSSPGRRWRWYAFDSTIVAPSALRSSGSRPLTVARVPTGMKVGVSMRPCGVSKTPARAGLSGFVRRRKANGIRGS